MRVDEPRCPQYAGDPAAYQDTDDRPPLLYPTPEALSLSHPPAPHERVWKNPAELFEAEHFALVRYLRALLPAYELPTHQAEDIAQETWAALIDQWDGVDRHLPWVYAVAKNKVHHESELRERRRRILERSRPRALWNQDESAPDTHTIVELEETFRRAVETLPQQERTAIMLSILDDRKAKEVAELMKISEGTAGVHLHRARLKLRGILEGLGALILVIAAMLNIPVPVRQPHGAAPGEAFTGEPETVSSASESAATTPDAEEESMTLLLEKARRYTEATRRDKVSHNVRIALDASPERFIDVALMQMSGDERAAVLAEFGAAWAAAGAESVPA